MRLIHRDPAEMDVVGRDQWDFARIGDVNELVFGGALLGEAVALKLDIETVAENGFELSDQRLGGGALPFDDQLVDRAAGAAGQSDEAFGMCGELVELHMRPVAGLGAEEGGTEELGEVLVAGGVLHQQRHGGRLAARALGGGGGSLELDRNLAADDGLDAGLGQGVAQLIGAEQVVDVGDRDGGHAVFLRQLGELGRAQRPFEERICALHPQMDEGFALGGHAIRLSCCAGSIGCGPRGASAKRFHSQVDGHNI